MPSNLGLVCITSDDAVRYRTITRTRLRSLPAEQQVSSLRELYADNARRLSKAIDFCAKRGIRLYRLTSDFLPQSEDEPGFSEAAALGEELGAIGRRAIERGIRIVMHPDQFVVLSSESAAVVENSVNVLRRHARLLDLLGQPRSAWAALEIHGGKGGRADALVAAINALPEEVRTRIALENDEYTYSAAEILDVCRRTGVPMVFDAHHHVVHEALESYDDPSVAEMTRAARETWPDRDWQLVHISNGRESFADPRHADYVDVMPSAFKVVPWIEVEAKMKERAIARLRRRWK